MLVPSKAGGLSIRTEGRLGFLPYTNWEGLKPLTLWRQFLAMMAQDKAVFKSHADSSLIFNRTSVGMAL